ncbi:serine protease [bacterium]|nr:serine protease [bacterium]MBU1958070.1 serine protease [bacterium]
MKNIVRVWIGDPYNEGHFNGTAFFIDAHTLVTAKHVVLNRDNEVYPNIYLTNTPDGGLTPIHEVILCERDMAVLKVKNAFDIEAVSFSDELGIGENVNVEGYYDNSSSQKSYANRVSGYQNGEHTYELQNHLTHGLSGSPVFLNGDICGVTKAINSVKNITYVIPISELCVKIDMVSKEKEELKEVYDDAPFSLGILKKIFNSVSVVSIPFVVILIVFILLLKWLFPHLELTDTIYALIFVAFVLAKLFNYLMRKFKKDKK